MSGIRSRDQKALFEYPNPLRERLGEAFFKQVPREPGVYFFKNGVGDILYVGKAKNLRNRLNSYKNARPNVVSRKVLRMLRLTQSIEVQICADETAALLTENQLLRAHRPPFNVVNTHTDTYYFILLKTLRVEGEIAFVRFELTTNPEAGDDDPAIKKFGVFKGRGLTRRSFQALLRLLSALGAEDEGFYFPTPLTRYRTPYLYMQPLNQRLLPKLHSFLQGCSPMFLEKVTEELLANERIPRFIHHVITEDLKMLEEFYEYGPGRLMRLKRANGIRKRPIAQDEIDDLLVLASRRARRNPGACA